MRFFTLVFLSLLVISCQSEGEISERKAQKIIENYLESNPLYETGNFSTNKQRLDSRKDQTLINELERLADEGLININDEKVRKKWFSKDSIFVISPSLSKTALPYVVKQDKHNATIKTIVYKLNEDGEFSIEKKNDKTAICIVVLDKEKTPFYHFGKDPYPTNEFITRKFRLKYNENSGWNVVK